MIVLLAHTAFSAVVGLMMADLFRKKSPSAPEVPGPSEQDSATQNSQLKTVSGSPMNASQALALAHIRQIISGERVVAEVGPSFDAARGHYVPEDAAEMERTMWNLAGLYPGYLSRGAEGAREGFPAMSSIAGDPGHLHGATGLGRKKTMSAYDLVGAELMFGADSDVLEALTVNGDLSGIIGGDGSSEIIGADLIGAARAGNPRAAAALRAVVAMRNAGAVIKNDLKNRRRYPLGFVPTAVDAGDSAVIPAAPQNLFRPERLVIPSDIAFDFGVQDVKVGNQSQFAQSVEVPAAVFTEVSIDTNVTFDTAEVGNQISILVRNKGTTDGLEFTAAAIGTIAKA